MTAPVALLVVAVGLSNTDVGRLDREVQTPGLTASKILTAQNRGYDERVSRQQQRQVPPNRSGGPNLTPYEMEQIQRGIDRQVQSSERGLIRRGLRE